LEVKLRAAPKNTTHEYTAKQQNWTHKSQPQLHQIRQDLGKFGAFYQIQMQYDEVVAKKETFTLLLQS